MVPAAFVVLAALPLTPNGKVDRKALPAPERAASSDGSYVAPRTPAEAVLVGIWAGVLRVERVGVHDNFFELGGDSILSMPVVSRADQAGLRLTPSRCSSTRRSPAWRRWPRRWQRSAAEQRAGRGAGAADADPGVVLRAGVSEPHHWNQAVLLRGRRPVSTGAAGAGPAGADRRITTRCGCGLIAARRAGAKSMPALGEKVSLSRIDLSASSEADREAVLQRTAAD